jgi:dynein heavy chain 1, cytosolic
LDDNKLLTLPNGERLSLPPNVRIMFEVQDLKYATLATVSRCGMVWFSEDVLSTEMVFENYFARVRHIPLEEGEDESFNQPASKSAVQEKEEEISPTIQTQREIAALMQPYFSADGLVNRCLEYALTQEHIMDFTRLRALGSLFSMLNQGIRNVLMFNQQHSDFPIAPEQLEQYIPKHLVCSVLWSFAGDSKLKSRCDLGDFIRSVTTINLPAQSGVPKILNGQTRTLMSSQ